MNTDGHRFKTMARAASSTSVCFASLCGSICGSKTIRDGQPLSNVPGHNWHMKDGFVIHPNSEVEKGSTGDPPVPLGHWPNGMGRYSYFVPRLYFICEPHPFRAAGCRTGRASCPCHPSLAPAYFGFSDLSGRGHAEPPTATVAELGSKN